MLFRIPSSQRRNVLVVRKYSFRIFFFSQCAQSKTVVRPRSSEEPSLSFLSTEENKNKKKMVLTSKTTKETAIHGLRETTLVITAHVCICACVRVVCGVNTVFGWYVWVARRLRRLAPLRFFPKVFSVFSTVLLRSKRGISIRKLSVQVFALQL